MARQDGNSVYIGSIVSLAIPAATSGHWDMVTVDDGIDDFVGPKGLALLKVVKNTESKEQRMKAQQSLSLGRRRSLRLESFLSMLQFEAVWALTSIVSGKSENIEVVIDHGAVPIFVKLLGSPSDDVREQAVWALGNVAGDSLRCRDLALGHGALIPLPAQLNEHAKLSMLRNATGTLGGPTSTWFAWPPLWAHFHSRTCMHVFKLTFEHPVFQ
ncbi:hypothetical protein PVL29_015589 [Vitis rotundifolia]|uniref:Uncharacterized protein n=1 Tax=Vitis rotundifolia TaxID=103349 RepID=A0AA38ZD34_VITRO|nr:hypothetical protein PVL29_015589 [Vitis rotundifolia]